MKLWLFLVEGNSDKIYVDKIIKYYVKSEKLKKEIKLEWIILDGKYNYDKKEKQIKQKINKFKNQNKAKFSARGLLKYGFAKARWKRGKCLKLAEKS